MVLSFLNFKRINQVIFSLILSVFLFLSLAHADVLFEGYSKVISNGNHVGYLILKYEFDNKKNQFSSTYFLKTNEQGGNITESLKALSTTDLVPISYQYTSLTGQPAEASKAAPAKVKIGKKNIGTETLMNAKTVDAEFKNNMMNFKITQNGKTDKISKPLPKGAFLSTFLVYLMLRNQEGLKSDQKYDYQAIAEEEADVFTGSAFVKPMEKLSTGFSAFKILNEFKSVKFVSFCNEQGEVYSTESPEFGISTELVAKPEMATNGMIFNKKIIKELFNNIPEGLHNSVSKKYFADNPTISPVKDFKGKNLNPKNPRTENLQYKTK